MSNNWAFVIDVALYSILNLILNQMIQRRNATESKAVTHK